MRALVLSDIHGNLEALQAVLADADGRFDQLWNLGDSVGYGGSPNAVCDLVRPLAALTVRGNHDRVCCGLSSPNGFNPVARAAALWTRDELTPDNLDWLRSLPQGPVHPQAEGVTCAHGSPLHEDHYILTMRDAWAPLQNSPRDLTFFGHTHLQGGFAQQDGNWREIRPLYPRAPRPGAAGAEGRRDSRADTRPDLSATAQSWAFPVTPGNRHLINPGSVGQPRDYDWRASYALYDDDAAQIVFHRVPYDLVASQGRILLAGLPERLALRLREGR